MKNLGKPGIVRGFSIILKEVREKSGENKSFSPHVIFINSLDGRLQSDCSLCCQ